MPADFEVVGWEDFNGDRYRGRPQEDGIRDVGGLLIHAWDTETNEDDYFWAFTLGPETFRDWEQWLIYIYSLMDMYGMELV
jgi:hypothetical protein